MEKINKFQYLYEIHNNIDANYVTEGCELVKSDWKIR